MKEKEINLVDLLVEILLHWRGIVVSMLVGGMLFGGFGYLRLVQRAEEQSARIEELKLELEEQLRAGDETKLKDAIKVWLADDEINFEETIREWANKDGEELTAFIKGQLEKELTELQLYNVNNTLYYEELCADKERYIDQSLVMRLDPDNVQKAEMTFQISAEGLEMCYNLERVYEDMVYNVELLEKLADQLGVSAPYVSELYSVSRGAGGLAYGSDSFKVTIIHYDEDICNMMAQTVIDYVNMKHNMMENSLESHDIQVVSRTLGCVAATNILSAQRNVTNDLLNLEATVGKLKGAFSDEEWYYYNLLTTGQVSGNPYVKSTQVMDQENEAEENIVDIINAGVTIVPQISIKYIFLGIAFFAFFYVFVISLLYVMNNKIRIVDNLQTMYGIPQLGLIPRSTSKNRIFGFVDGWILALRYWNQRRFTTEEALELTSVAVKMAVKKSAVEKVCFVGCNLKNETLQSCERFEKLFEGEKEEIQILNNVLYDIQSMEGLCNADGVVLVETVGVTLYTELTKELELLGRQEIKVLGGIIVE